MDDEKVVSCFGRYLEQDSLSVSRAEFEANLSAKFLAPAFLADLEPLLPAGTRYEVTRAGALVSERLIAKLRGKPWKGAVS